MTSLDPGEFTQSVYVLNPCYIRPVDKNEQHYFSSHLRKNMLKAWCPLAATIHPLWMKSYSKVRAVRLDLAGGFHILLYVLTD